MTKQASGQRVAELEAHGYVERRRDAEDGRATRACFTAEGWRFLLDAQAVRRSIEAEYRAALGQAGWDGLNDALRRLLGDDGTAPPA